MESLADDEPVPKALTHNQELSTRAIIALSPLKICHFSGKNKIKFETKPNGNCD
jgi:hypothetical protein